MFNVTSAFKSGENAKPSPMFSCYWTVLRFLTTQYLTRRIRRRVAGDLETLAVEEKREKR
jgi:hypothetical protein